MTSGKDYCQQCGHLKALHYSDIGCSVGHYLPDDRTGYDPQPCSCEVGKVITATLIWTPSTGYIGPKNL